MDGEMEGGCMESGWQHEKINAHRLRQTAQTHNRLITANGPANTQCEKKQRQLY